jgi:hypothetical protein
MRDLRGRLANRVQLTTDGHRSFLSAVEAVDLDAEMTDLIAMIDAREASLLSAKAGSILCGRIPHPTFTCKC